MSQRAIESGPVGTHPRDRGIIVAALALIVVLAWVYLLFMDWGMRHMDAVANVIIMPAMTHWGVWDLILVFLMWTIMMIGMMIPSASPAILLFTAVNRREGRPKNLVRTSYFTLGYVAAWTGFSAVATLAQWALLSAALVSPMMNSTSEILGAGLLFVAGVFQLSHFKDACLAHCRSPLGFFLTEWKAGSWGAFRMGLKHGGYCLGCCWAIMGLLFAFGVMNLFWVAGLSIFVLVEKVAPTKRLVSSAAGLIFVCWGGWILYSTLARGARGF